MKNNHMKFVRRLMALVMAIICLCAASLTAFAADSGISFGISTSPCQGNRSQYAFPAEAGSYTQGYTYYVNVAATSDFQLRQYEFYIKAPGQSSYSLADIYSTSGYFRWHFCEYTFTQAGTYYVKPVITTTSGKTYSCEYSYYVNGSGNKSASAAAYSSGNYYYGGNYYNVVPNLKSAYCFNQMDYSRFVNGNGSNRGCTATAMCTAYSIYHDSPLSPNSVKWTSEGTYWEYCTTYSENGNSYRGDHYSQSEALKCVYNCVLSGKPIIIGVKGTHTNMHVVTAVGIRSGANYNSISMSDILIIDPNGGSICSLSKYTSIDTAWNLRIAI